MLQSIIKEYLQEMLGRYINTNEKFERLFNGDKVDVSSFELPTDSKKAHVKGLLDRAWLDFEINDTDIVQSIQLRMNIFKILNAFEYQTQRDVERKLHSLTESYFSKDIYNTCNELADMIQKELFNMECEVIKPNLGSLRILFTPDKDFFDDSEEDMDIMVMVGNVLNGFIKLTKNDEGVFQYVFKFTNTNRLGQPYYVKKLKEQLSRELDSLYPIAEGSTLHEYFKKRRAEQDKIIAVDENNNKDKSREVLSKSATWQGTKNNVND